MANPNLTTEQTQFIMNRVKHTGIDALDVIPYTLSTDGLSATPVSDTNPSPVKITDGNNDATVSSAINGEKGLHGVTLGMSIKEVISESSLNTPVAGHFPLTSGQSYDSGWIDTQGYAAIILTAVSNTSGGAPFKLEEHWSTDTSSDIYQDSATIYLVGNIASFATSTLSGAKRTIQMRYVRYKWTLDTIDQGTGSPAAYNFDIFNVRLLPAPVAYDVAVVNTAAVTAIGNGDPLSSPVIVGGVDVASAPSAFYPLVVNTSGKPSVNTLTGSTVANNATEAGNPHKIGYTANSSVPTAVTTGRRVTAWGDLNGRSQVSLGDPGVTLLASASRTTTQTSADLTNATCRGIVVTLDMTVVTAGPSVTLTINYKDPASGKYINLLTGAAVATVSTNTYRIYPGLTPVANATVSDVLPRTFQIVVTANNANAGTYSVGYNLIP